MDFRKKRTWYLRLFFRSKFNRLPHQHHLTPLISRCHGHILFLSLFFLKKNEKKEDEAGVNAGQVGAGGVLKGTGVL
jgi:hypothetical protein